MNNIVNSKIMNKNINSNIVMSNSYNELIKEIDQIKKKDKFQALKRLHEHINAVDADARLQKQIKQLEYEINNADIKNH